MQLTGETQNLSQAINFLEELLNKDGQAVIDTIKKYKELKNTDNAESWKVNNDQTGL